MRRGLWIFLFGLLLAVTSAAGVSRAEIVDRIVATVNGDIITLKELNERMEPLLKASGTQDPARIESMRREVLDSMIERILTVQEGTKLNMQVTGEEVDRAIEGIKKQNNLDDQGFEEGLARQGMTLASFRDDVQAEILRSKLINREVRSRVVVPMEKVDAYYEAHKDRYSIKPKGHVRSIVLAIPDNSSDGVVEAAMGQARSIVSQLKDGLDFAEAASRYSDGPNAKEGGDMGEVSFGDMAEPVRVALEGLKDGETSQPVRIGQSIMIFQLVRRMEVDEEALKKAKDSIRDQLANEMMQQQYEEWVKELREKAHIKVTL